MKLYDKIALGAAAMLVAAGGAIMLGDSTTAQWSDSATRNIDVMVAGDLAAFTIGGTSWINITTPTDEEGVAPSETVVASQAVDVAVEGNNLKAIASLATLDGSDNPYTMPEGYAYAWRILNRDGQDVTGWLSPSATYSYMLEDSQLSSSELDGSTDMTIEVTITYPEDIEFGGQLPVKFGVNLEQVL